MTRFAVMGLGKMGVDWVANLLEAGHEVVGFDTAATARERAPGALGKGLGWIAKKRHPEESGFVDEATARFRIVDSEGTLSDELGSCQVLLEVILEDLGDVTRLINAALERGINGVGGIALDLSNRDELERQALDLAVDDARDEAARVARRFGVTLGPVLDVHVDRHEVRPVMMEAMAMKAADSGPDFSPGETVVRRNVQATFGVRDAASP